MAMPGSISVGALQAELAAAMQPVTGAETVPLRQALNRVLEADLISPIDVPGHANSAMDGWAFDGSALAQAPLHLQQVGIRKLVQTVGLVLLALLPSQAG